MHKIDPLDAKILLALDHDPSATVVALAQRLGVARNTVQARLRNLGDGEVLGSYSRRVNPRSLGYNMTVFVELSIRQGRGVEARGALHQIPEIVEIHSTTGDADMRLRVVARDTTDLHRITNLLLETPGVLRTNSAISLSEEMPLQLTSLLRRQAEESH